MIIAFANQKGGVAKTTTTHNIGVALWECGKKVLLVDLDSQASLTILTGLEPLDIENNIVEALKKNGKPVKECITVLKDGLHIIPSIIDLAYLETTEMQARASREMILGRTLEQIKDDYDYVLIDCPPQLSILTINALSCADAVVVVAKTDYLSYRGLQQLQDTIDEIRELINPRLDILGAVATLYEMRVNNDREILEQLIKEYKVLGTIKKMAAVKKGVYDGKSVVELEPKSDVAKEYRKIAEIIMKGGVR
jgi:chromosome partitioning protein